MVGYTALKRLAFALPGLLGLLSACGGADPLAAGACITNQDCGSGQQCISGKCKSVSLPGCKNDDACGLGEFCDPADSVCKPIVITGCSTDEACPPNQRCNTLTGVCINGRRACTSEGQCVAIGKHCDLTLQECVDCYEPSHCAAPTTCVANQCLDPSISECAMDNECAPPQTVCESTQCVPGCGQSGTSLNCGLGQVCNTTTGRCETAQVNCSDDTQCSPPSSICESTQCIPGCTQVGGLQCTGGFVCNNSTGRCEPPSGCTNDTTCGAPAAICENNACVPGCSQPGGITCGAGTVCNNATGRCVTVQGPCSTDANCSPPTTICETGQCIGGCGQAGGLQCNGNTICNATTGRCDQGPTPCTTDAFCGAPVNICNLQTGACDPGCGTTGCTAPEICNAATGRCYDPTVPVGAPLNSTCNANADCASGVCFDFTPVASAIGRRCVTACGNSGDCPASFTCYDHFGGKMCLSNQLFSSSTFGTPNGGACTGAGQCKSNFCPNNQCIDSCSENSDCAGTQCSWREVVSDYYLSACLGSLGGGGNGASCASETQCRSGVCYGSGICGDLCGSTSDCPNGNVCAPVNYSIEICTVEVFGICLDSEWSPNFVKACVQASHGNAANGTACADTNGSNCRGGFCLAATNQCTGTCARDADCPGGMVCGVENYGDLAGITIYVNMCRPR